LPGHIIIEIPYSDVIERPYSDVSRRILLHLMMAGSSQLKGLAASILVLYFDVSVFRLPTV